MANERRLIDANAYAYPGDLVNEPTVDAVEVCYCKDCKHYDRWADGRAMNHCDKHDRTAYDDDFCSYGEKSGTQPQREDV